MQYMDQVYFGNTVLQWSWAAGVALATFIGLQIIKRVVIARLRKLAVKTATDTDDFILDLLGNTKFVVVLILSLFAGAFMLTLPGRVLDSLTFIAVAASLAQILLWGNRLIDHAITKFTQSRLNAEDPASTTAAGIIGTVARIVFFSMVFLVLLATIGFDVDTLVAGMGIGGIAIALAVNGILQDLFGSLTIALDKPFAVGDFINVGEFSGTVENVGLKSTRVRSATGEQLVMSNGDLLSSRLRNYGRMDERRGKLAIGITYDTPADKLEAIPSIIEDIISKQPRARFERAHFASFGDFSLNFTVVYWLETPAYSDFMDTTQEINLEIVRRFEKAGIEMAFPTQTLYINQEETP